MPALAVILSLGYDMAQPSFGGIITVLGGKRAGQAMGPNVFTLFVGFGLESLGFGASIELILGPFGASLDRNSRRVRRLDPEVPKAPTLNQKMRSTALGEQCDEGHNDHKDCLSRRLPSLGQFYIRSTVCGDKATVKDFVHEPRLG